MIPFHLQENQRYSFDQVYQRRSQMIYLSFRTLLICRIHEDATIHQCTVNISYHGAHVPGTIWGTSILKNIQMEHYIYQARQLVAQENVVLL